MYKILIVDDEFPARELLKMAIDWKAIGCEIVGEARDGKDAYEKYQKQEPDLIITDIQMPVMDGLELIKKIKEEKPDQKFAILSCYESFQYARAAMKLGVRDYLIKDSYTEEELYLLIRSMETERLASFPKDQKKEVKKITQEGMGNHFVKPGYSYYLAIVLTNKAEDAMKILRRQENILAALENNHEICILGELCNNPSFLLNYQKRFDSILQIKNNLEEYIQEAVTIGVSQVFQEVEQFKKKHEEAKQSLEYRVFTGPGKIVFYENIDKKREVQILEQLNKEFKNIQKAVEEKRIEEIERVLSRLYGSDVEGMMHCNYLYYLNSLFFGYLTYTAVKNNIPLETFFEEGAFSLNQINEKETYKEMKEWILNKIQMIVEYEKRKNQYSNIVENAILYLEKNYKMDFSVEEMAEAIGVNKSYLSRIFKAEVGKNISVYLNEFRISQAIYLMEKDEYKIVDIVYKVGYNSSQNFYHAFKQVVGMTPKEYKNTRMSSKTL